MLGTVSLSRLCRFLPFRQAKYVGYDIPVPRRTSSLFHPEGNLYMRLTPGIWEILGIFAQTLSLLVNFNHKKVEDTHLVNDEVIHLHFTTAYVVTNICQIFVDILHHAFCMFPRQYLV